MSHSPDQRSRAAHWSAPRKTSPIPKRLNPIGGSKYSGPSYQHLQEVETSEREIDVQKGWEYKGLSENLEFKYQGTISDFILLLTTAGFLSTYWAISMRGKCRSAKDSKHWKCERNHVCQWDKKYTPPAHFSCFSTFLPSLYLSLCLHFTICWGEIKTRLCYVLICTAVASVQSKVAWDGYAAVRLK